MSDIVQEIYQQTVRPLSRQEQLELVALIINDITGQRTTNGEQKRGGKKLSDLFGSVSLGYPTGIDNEKIDADLAHEYANTHEDEN
jgi:hypothetical protein